MGGQTSLFQLAQCIVGIVGSLSLYSLLQERLMSERFGEDQFKFSLLLVLVNRLITFSTTVISSKVAGASLKPAAPLWTYAAVSASNVMATTCQYEALKHVSLPVQTLGKSAKMLPVMLWGTVLLGRRYGVRAYICATAVAVGCTVFLSSGEITSNFAKSRGTATAYGLALMTLYLGFDGFTSTFQSRLFKGYQTTVSNQVMHTTAFSALYALLGLTAAGQLGESLSFLQRHSIALPYMLLLSAAATVGQLCILQTIKTFGPLVLAMVMTSRQFLSILLSCLVFRHPLTWKQWLGVMLVFAAVTDQALSKRKQSHRKDREQ